MYQLSNPKSMAEAHAGNVMALDSGTEHVFHCTEDGAYKFWRVRVEAGVQTVCYGRIGTPGQTLSKTFDSPDAARAVTERLIAQKLAKGYHAVTPQEAAVAPPPRPRTVPEHQLLLPFDAPAAAPVPPVAPVAPPPPPTLALDF